MADRYNGWKNYETWNVALWLDNDQGTQELTRDLAQEACEGPASENVIKGIWTRAEDARFELADRIKDFVTENLIPDLGASMASDLLNSAVSEVDWDEIAEHYLADIEDEAQPAQA